MNCAFFYCDLISTRIFLGDNGKYIRLCLKHYKMVDEAVKNRFKND